MIKETLKEILSADFPDLALKKSGLTKADIKPLADQGDLDAMLILLFGLSCNAVGKIWNEDFEDEDTHEITSIERWEHIDSPLFSPEPGEVEMLSKTLASRIPSQTTETLKNWALLFDRNALYPAIHEELARRGEVEGLARIGAFYAEGFESDWNIEMLDYSPLEHPQDLADDFDPCNAVIIISGHPLYLDQIEFMVEDLTKAHGDPDNEVGLFVPLKYVFQTLGFDWVGNTGNLMAKWRRTESVLTLELECNPRVDEALVEAFQKAYPKLTVETIS